MRKRIHVQSFIKWRDHSNFSKESYTGFILQSESSIQLVTILFVLFRKKEIVAIITFKLLFLLKKNFFNGKGPVYWKRFYFIVSEKNNFHVKSKYSNNLSEKLPQVHLFLMTFGTLHMSSE